MGVCIPNFGQRHVRDTLLNTIMISCPSMLAQICSLVRLTSPGGLVARESLGICFTIVYIFVSLICVEHTKYKQYANYRLSSLLMIPRTRCTQHLLSFGLLSKRKRNTCHLFDCCQYTNTKMQI